MLARKQVVAILATTTAAIAVAPGAGGGSPSAEASLLVEINRVRAAHGLAPLRPDATLRRAARSHSADMLRRGYFSHDRITRRLASFGVRSPLVGENLAWGTRGGASPGRVVRLWLRSATHRANLLRPGFRRVGIGSLAGPFAGHDEAVVVTADFAGG